MSRKHFVLIAQAIRYNIPDRELRKILAESLISGLAACNPNFSAAVRFLDAAVGEWKSRFA
jgi:hypothetical protein